MGPIEEAVKALVDDIWTRDPKMSKTQLRKRVLECFQKQLHRRYKYLIGEWRNGVRAKQVYPPKSVPISTVIAYLKRSRLSIVLLLSIFAFSTPALTKEAKSNKTSETQKKIRILEAKEPFLQLSSTNLKQNKIYEEDLDFWTNGEHYIGDESWRFEYPWGGLSKSGSQFPDWKIYTFKNGELLAQRVRYSGQTGQNAAALLRDVASAYPWVIDVAPVKGFDSLIWENKEIKLRMLLLPQNIDVFNKLGLSYTRIGGYDLLFESYNSRESTDNQKNVPSKTR